MPRPLRLNQAENAFLAAQDAISTPRADRMWQVAAQRQRSVTLLMEDVVNPFNLAAIARTCDAFGVQRLGFMSQQHAAFDPREDGERASRSAAKWLDYTRYEQNTHAVLEAFREEGYHLIATSADANAVPLSQADLTQEKLLILVGNERSGLSEMALQQADTHVLIPMVGMVQSLNVSVATALVLYELSRQRQAAHFFYTQAQAQALMDTWIKREQVTKHGHTGE